ncbi:Metallo-dependent phosphatase-like protein [Russula aff. rugulosa BPL654]|nr:Metallo-dependent phosphatase-like protein [Russula aff. rugulosa BPL654]
MTRALQLLLCVALALRSSAVTYGPSSYAPPGAFPTSLYQSYYNNPTATSAQPSPTKYIRPGSLTRTTYPSIFCAILIVLVQVDTQDPHPLPPRVPDEALLENAQSQVKWLFANPTIASSSCALCIASLQIAKFLSFAAPEQTPLFFVFICQQFRLSSSCNSTFGATTFGSVLTQVVANANISGYDGQLICLNFIPKSCPVPPTPPLNLTGWFSKPKPNPLPPPKTPSGNRVKVLHLSDFHIDPRAYQSFLLEYIVPPGIELRVPSPVPEWHGYATGSEGNCTSGLCCRANNPNSNSPNKTLVPAPRYGWFQCDTPFSLAAAVLEAIPVLTGTENTGFGWTIYTGDLVSHDPENQHSRDYVMYTERTLGSGPVYPALGNHDSYNQAQDAPHALGGALGEQFSWNYDHVSSLWSVEQWLPQTSVSQARAHYAAYSVQRIDGLRVISLNTDMSRRFGSRFEWVGWKQCPRNPKQSILPNVSRSQPSIFTGWLISDISVDRFSPHVIANIFFGHTHEDQFSVKTQIFYANNATNISAQTALTTSWIGPSITPLTNLNSGFRVYEVDSATFDILDAHTWWSDVQASPGLDGQTQFGPTYSYEYSTRDAYGSGISWGSNDPLNATWWHHVTEKMQANSSLVSSTFTNFQGKQSVHTTPCNTTECVNAKICYMRSGSASIALQNCQSGFGSVTIAQS